MNGKLILCGNSFYGIKQLLDECVFPDLVRPYNFPDMHLSVFLHIELSDILLSLDDVKL